MLVGENFEKLKACSTVIWHHRELSFHRFQFVVITLNLPRLGLINVMFRVLVLTLWNRSSSSPPHPQNLKFLHIRRKDTKFISSNISYLLVKPFITWKLSHESATTPPKYSPYGILYLNCSAAVASNFGLK